MAKKTNGTLDRLKHFLYTVEVSEKKKKIKPSSEYTATEEHFTPSGESGMTESSTTITNYQTFSLAGIPVLDRKLGGRRDTYDSRPGWGDDGPIPSRDVHVHETQHYGDTNRKFNIKELTAHLVKKEGKFLGIPFKKFEVSVDIPKEAESVLSDYGGWSARGNIRKGRIYLVGGKETYDAVEAGVSEEDSSGLSSKVSSAIALTGVISGLFFISSSITGNVISNLSSITSSFLGAGLLVVGVVASFFWVQNRRQK